MRVLKPEKTHARLDQSRGQAGAQSLARSSQASWIDLRGAGEFSQVLTDVMEEDNGLLLRVTAFERMMEERETPFGWTARILDLFRRRSGKIFRLQRVASEPMMEGMKNVTHQRAVQ